MRQANRQPPDWAHGRPGRPVGSPPVVAPIEFQYLAGQEVSSVCFVHDYVELHFDGPIFRWLADPTVEVEGERFEFPAPGSRDALSRLVGQRVRRTVDEPDRLVLAFDADSGLVVPRVSSVAGPEVAQFVPFVDGRLDVARMLTWENLLASEEP